MKGIRLKGVVMEDFANYKVPSMFLITSYCDWKCCKEQNIDISICQNQPLCEYSIKEYTFQAIYNAYKTNPISKAIVVGGLEPFLQFDEVRELISYFRQNECNDYFVIYTGYYPEEIEKEIEKLRQLPNIIIKFGRFVPDQNNHYDELLGIKLASTNQYSRRIS